MYQGMRRKAQAKNTLAMPVAPKPLTMFSPWLHSQECGRRVIRILANSATFACARVNGVERHRSGSISRLFCDFGLGFFRFLCSLPPVPCPLFKCFINNPLELVGRIEALGLGRDLCRVGLDFGFVERQA